MHLRIIFSKIQYLSTKKEIKRKREREGERERERERERGGREGERERRKEKNKNRFLATSLPTKGRLWISMKNSLSTKIGTSLRPFESIC